MSAKNCGSCQIIGDRVGAARSVINTKFASSTKVGNVIRAYLLLLFFKSRFSAKSNRRFSVFTSLYIARSTTSKKVHTLIKNNYCFALWWNFPFRHLCIFCSRSKRAEKPCLDKENIARPLSPAKNEDLSFYASSSPPKAVCAGTSPNHCNHNLITRRPLEDHDPNSSDSGYHTNYRSDNGKFSSYASPCRGSFESASIGSMEDEFFEDFSYIEPLEDNLPQDFNKLINGPIAFHSKNKETTATKSTSPKDLVIRPLFRRALSFQNEKSLPASSKARSCLFTESRPFKRPEPPQEFENPTNTKKQKVDDDQEIPSVPWVQRPILKRAYSATEESIMCAVQKSSVEPDLIGDFSKTFCLPLTQGRHQDLKSITPATLARLIRGDYNGNISSFKVIDCRYPYEYDGGHIEGAVNVYTKDQCMELLNNFNTAANEHMKRSNILIFHCEFSSERGPNL